MDLRRKKLVGTLVYPKNEEGVLLGKKTKKLCQGYWNGWGGEKKDGETIRQAAARETLEESGLEAKPENLVYVGKVTFHNTKADGRKFDVEVHLFLLYVWSGILKPNLEMKDPRFWPDLPPRDELMPSDPDWLPLVLAGKWIEGDTWQRWIEEPGTPMRVVLTRPSEIRIVDKLGDVD